MAGELTIEQNADGTATINFPGGGQHTVSGGNAVQALQDAYGSRIGSVTTSTRSAAEQQAWRDQTYGAAESAAARANATAAATAANAGLNTFESDPSYDQYLGQTEGRVVDGINIPAWVDEDYLGSYVSSVKQGNPRKPNMRELTELLAGVSVEQLYATTDVSEWSKYTNKASSLLYGVVGSNTDTRNWSAIMESENPVVAAQIATAQMYGGTTVRFQSGGYETDANGNTVFENDEPKRLPPSLYIVGNNGTVLTGLPANSEYGVSIMQDFGIRGTEWVDAAITAMQNTDKFDQYQSVFDVWKETYNPWANYENLWEQNFVTCVAPTIDPFNIVTGQLGKSGTETTTTT